MEQPAPSGGTGDCWAELIEIIETRETWVGFRELLPEMRARRELGIERYGQPVRRDDGRDAKRDAEEEALDLAVYLVRLDRLQDAWSVLRIFNRVRNDIR